MKRPAWGGASDSVRNGKEFMKGDSRASFFPHQHLKTFYITFVFMKDIPQPAMLISVGSVEFLRLQPAVSKLLFCCCFYFFISFQR